jgi:hypothetical protein
VEHSSSSSFDKVVALTAGGRSQKVKGPAKDWVKLALVQLMSIGHTADE